jgi:UDP-N-acetyl-D-glucosamine dehydrogenase
LTWKAREFGLHTRFIELAGEINSSMPDYVISKITGALNDVKKSIKGSKVLVLGIAYKKNVDDMRESPSVILMEKLRDLGAEVSYSDPHIPVFPKMREHYFDLSSVNLSKELLASYDCVLLATDHDEFNYELIQSSALLIVDSRGRYLNGYTNVVKA